ncbi:hypothetical protein WDW86_08125 [Bdellovibrionota bacterium FG-2]
MSKKKNKFDLTNLVHEGAVKNGETLYFVSDPQKTGVIAKQPNGEYKVVVGKETLTVHAFAQWCLGQEPPDHGSRWLRNAGGKTLYDLWQAESWAEAA